MLEGFLGGPHAAQRRQSLGTALHLIIVVGFKCFCLFCEPKNIEIFSFMDQKPLQLETIAGEYWNAQHYFIMRSRSAKHIIQRKLTFEILINYFENVDKYLKY